MKHFTDKKKIYSTNWKQKGTSLIQKIYVYYIMLNGENLDVYFLRSEQ